MIYKENGIVHDSETGATLEYFHAGLHPEYEPRDRVSLYRFTQNGLSFELWRKSESGGRQAAAMAEREIKAKYPDRWAAELDMPFYKRKSKFNSQLRIIHSEIIDVDPDVMPLDLKTVELLLRMFVEPTKKAFSRRDVTVGMYNCPAPFLWASFEQRFWNGRTHV